MSNKNICPVHGEHLANEVQNLSAKKAEKLGRPELTVDPENCTCDVGITGPAGDPELLAKGSGSYDHPQPIAKGPAADPELLAKGSGAYDHPQPIKKGPAKE